MAEKLRFGWNETDITPDGRVSIPGQFYSRISQYVETPLTATALAIESGKEQAILCSVDQTHVKIDNTVIGKLFSVRRVIPAAGSLISIRYVISYIPGLFIISDKIQYIQELFSSVPAQASSKLLQKHHRRFCGSEEKYHID